MKTFLKAWAISTALVALALGIGFVWMEFLEPLFNAFIEWLLNIVLPPPLFGLFICAVIGLFMAVFFMAMNENPWVEYDD